MHTHPRHWATQWAIAIALACIFTAPVQAAKTCYDCHKEAKAKFSSRKNVHAPVQGTNCESCHKRHGFANKLVLVSTTNDLCYSCHTDMKESVAAGHAHYPVDKGICWDCHDPHASDKPGLLRQGPDGLNDRYSCLTCHQDLAPILKDAKYPHQPFAQEACLTCHDAHSGKHGDLLTDTVENLCASCHKSQDKSFVDAHADKHTAGLGCSDCHTAHSSNNEHLMSDRAHPPFAEGSCDACHSLPNESGDVTWAEGVTPGNVCSGCHSDQPDATKKQTPHAAVEEDNCDNCHSAHASRYPKLLLQPESQLCSECHADVLVNDSLSHAHFPVAVGSCGSCHEVHGSDHAGLLKSTDASLCLGCHTGFAAERDSAAVQHAVTDDCLQCHAPHQSQQVKLLRQDPVKTCLECHDPSGDMAHAESFHLPYKNGGCASCHEPHFSNNAHLTRQAGSQLCLSCHTDIGKRLQLATVHAVAEDCQTCHLPHVSKHTSLLTSSQSTLCSDCHDAATIGTDKTFVHDPIATGDCTGCHNAHGSTLPKLISGRISMVQVGSMTMARTPNLTEKRSDLCYTCHETAQQEFRKQLIHQPVVDGNCDACHSAHGSDHRAFTTGTPAEMCGSCHSIDEELESTHGGHPMANADCIDCHNPHASDRPGLARANTHPPYAEKSCESCHARGDDGAFALAAETTELCITCHSDVSDEMAKSHQHVPFASGECSSCHAMHASDHVKLLKDDGNDVCVTCHDSFSALAKLPVQHEPFAEGNCRKCHNPHASDNEHLATQPAETFCLSCHTALKEQMAKGTVHDPVQSGDCNSCHVPHAGNDKALLTASKQELCANCHETSSAALTTAHFGFDITQANCQNCHVAHVSRKDVKALLLPDAHKPFASRDCTKCHEPTGARALLTTQRELCLGCHSSFEPQLRKAVVHAPVAESDGCTGCHGPHVGFGKSLQIKDGVDACLTCHDTREFKGAFKHEAAFESGCGTCHDPHSASFPGLLATPDIMDLCKGCHMNAEKTHYHPMGKGVIDPLTKLELNCLGCHSAHSSDVEQLLLADKTRKLCLNCHDVTM